MKIETYIDSLVSYAMNCGLTEPEEGLLRGIAPCVHADLGAVPEIGYQSGNAGNECGI